MNYFKNFYTQIFWPKCRSSFFMEKIASLTVTKWWQFKIFKGRYVLNRLFIIFKNKSHRSKAGKKQHTFEIVIY